MGGKLTSDDFIIKSKDFHCDKYDYSYVKYINKSTKVKIRCINHNHMFEQTPYNHLRGNGGCPLCNGKIKLTTEDFIEKSKKIYGEKYDYSFVKYVNANTKIKIICPEHGEFIRTPSSHLNGSGCPKCSIDFMDKKIFIKKSNEIHNNKFDYSLLDYLNATTKVKIICKQHGVFEQVPYKHIQGNACPICAGHSMNTERFIEKSKFKHGGKYDYSLVEYINSTTKIKLICVVHGIFEQTPSGHLSGGGCPKCVGKNKTTEDFIIKSKEIHNDKYYYSLTDYINSNTKVKIICPTHGVFEQDTSNHLSGQGCPICNLGFSKTYKLNLLNNLEHTDLSYFDPIELQIIIGQGNLPKDFESLILTDAGSEERLTTLRELKEQLNSESKETETDTEESNETINSTEEFIQSDEVDEQITNEDVSEPRLPQFNQLDSFHSIDNELYATMDEDAFNSLIQYRLRLMWNDVLNNKISVENLRNENGKKYFTIIKDMFFDEYNIVSTYTPPLGYSFKYQPNLMQKLTVNRLLKNKCYGNWSGTGAGKTVSFIISSRELNSKLTLVIDLNSTIKQTCESIKEVYPDSLTFTEYEVGFVFDTNKHNYLVLNYEKFQQSNSEELFQSLTNNNQIDFVVIDEVHNAKQRDDSEESIRRGVLKRLLGRIRENNQNVHTLAMSATPVINNLFEAKSLLQLLTGIEYEEVKDRNTLSNAISMFQLLSLNGLRFLPIYDITMTELTGHNMSNLKIDGSHLLENLLELSDRNYIDTEKLLLADKLESIKPYIRKGVIIYTYFTSGFVGQIEKYVKNLGFSVGSYTGDESIEFRNNNLNLFKSGDLDILIGSKPIGTGVDGLQNVCDRMIIITLPWTDSEYTQLKGRIYRQGSDFKNVEIIIPQVKIELEEGNFWSWDVQRLNLIKNKRMLADVVVDGVIPSKKLPSRETMHKKAIESLQSWKDRVANGEIIDFERKTIKIDLYPEIDNEEQRQNKITSELSEFNRRGKIMRSENMNEELTKNPESFFRYHALRKERMESWEEIPYEYIATKIKNKNQIIADFGCGENKFKDCLPNKVYSFDHISFDDTVIACDMKNVPLGNESIDVAMFSLSLWGSNYEDYIKESYRVLNYGGVIHIAEPSKSYDTTELKDELKNLLTRNGFDIVGDIENRGKFIYIKGLK